MKKMTIFLCIFAILIVDKFCSGQTGYNFLRPNEGNIAIPASGTGLSPYIPQQQANIPLPIYSQSDIAAQKKQPTIGIIKPTVRPIFQVRPTVSGVISNSLGNSINDQYQGGDYSAIPGQPGIDYPVYAEIPRTNFKCDQQRFPGYYADIEAQCQIFHICSNNRTFDFLCPNGTIFSQETLVCVWWNQFDCAAAPSLYENNALIYDYGQTGQPIGSKSLQSVGIATRPVTPTYSIPSRSIGVSNLYNQKGSTVPYVTDPNYPALIPGAAKSLPILRPTYSGISPIPNPTTPVSGR